MIHPSFDAALEQRHTEAHAQHPELVPSLYRESAFEAEFWLTMDPPPKGISPRRPFQERVWAARALTVQAKRTGLARWWRLVVLALMHVRWLTATWLFRAGQQTSRAWWSSAAGCWMLCTVCALACWGIRKQTSELRYESARRFSGWISRSPYASPKDVQP